MVQFFGGLPRGSMSAGALTQFMQKPSLASTDYEIDSRSIQVVFWLTNLTIFPAIIIFFDKIK